MGDEVGGEVEVELVGDDDDDDPPCLLAGVAVAVAAVEIVAIEAAGVVV